MGKFNDYLIYARDTDGRTIVEKTISAISYESAWHKAVNEAFEVWHAPYTIQVHRMSSPSFIGENT